MPDSLLSLDAPAAGLRLLVCTARDLSLDASARHALAPGSAGVLAEALTAALLLAAHHGSRVDVQLECNGPVRGLLVDADESGAVRGLVRVNTLEGRPRSDELTRFDPRPLLASPHDERAGNLSILRAPGGGQPAHRAAFPFAGADLAAALTLHLRGEREAGGEMAVEALVSSAEAIAALAGVLVSPLDPAESERARALGKPLRQGGLAAALLRAGEALGARPCAVLGVRTGSAPPGDGAAAAIRLPLLAGARGARACGRSAPRSCARWRRTTAGRASPATSAPPRTRSPRTSCCRSLKAEAASSASAPHGGS